MPGAATLAVGGGLEFQRLMGPCIPIRDLPAALQNDSGARQKRFDLLLRRGGAGDLGVGLKVPTSALRRYRKRAGCPDRC